MLLSTDYSILFLCRNVRLLLTIFIDRRCNNDDFDEHNYAAVSNVTSLLVMKVTKIVYHFQLNAY